MENTKTVKALKKQLVAAIAMVLVAAIALGSSTYAWFVSNSQVTGTTSQISAQSNSAYLVIDTKKTDAKSQNVVTAETPKDGIQLYPAQVVNGTANDGKQTYRFESAYAAEATAATEKKGTRFIVGEDGTAAEAVDAKYAYLNTFYIGTGTYDGNFTNLTVSNVEVSSKDTNKADLVNAMRVLITCGDKWVVWKNGAQVTTVNTLGNASLALVNEAADDIIAATVGKDDEQTVNVYVFYDGAETEVRSDNLTNLKDCNVAITFDATPIEFGKNAGN